MSATSRRILITGVSSLWGGRLAQQLERDPAIETVVGIDTEDPRHELLHTEFVRVGLDVTLLRRIIRAARIDTVVDTRLVADTDGRGARSLHEINVVGTRNLLAAAGGGDTPVRKLVFKGSDRYYGTDRDDPAFFTEDLSRTRAPRTPIERDVLEAERALAQFADDHPEIVVTRLRIAAAIAGEEAGAHLAYLSLPVVPSVLGFDPRCQFIHEEDVIGVLTHAVAHDLPGAYNAAGDGVLALSEVASLLGKPLLPLLPPWGTVFAATQLRRLGLRIPVDTLRDLRHGRGLDNRRLKAAGYHYRYTSREAVLRLRAHQRVRPLLGRGEDSFRYEREVEAFLRWSPSVQTAPAPLQPPIDAAPTRGEAPVEPTAGYAELAEDELIEILPTLDTDVLGRLRRLEEAGPGRRAVLEALEHQLSLRRAGWAGPAS
jgi:UDP-glucose 4-epimerase